MNERAGLQVAEKEYRMGVSPKNNGRPWLWYAAAVVLFIGDRLLKGVALSGFYRSVLPGFEFVLFKNPGIAFSLPLQETIFWLLALPVYAMLLWMFVSAIRKRDHAVSSTLLFVILGASSNLFDRMFSDATIDYFLFFGISAINIADTMIVGGVLRFIFGPKKGKH